MSARPSGGSASPEATCSEHQIFNVNFENDDQRWGVCHCPFGQMTSPIYRRCLSKGVWRGWGPRQTTDHYQALGGSPRKLVTKRIFSSREDERRSSFADLWEAYALLRVPTWRCRFLVLRSIDNRAGCPIVRGCQRIPKPAAPYHLGFSGPGWGW